MKLLPRESLIKTGDVDHADWMFRPVLGAILRMRYKQIVSFLGGQRFHRLLEIGYGSGIFLPELADHCQELHGIDIHNQDREVSQVLKGCGCEALLVSGSAARLPYEDRFFDGIVAVSTLEFIDDVDSACREIARTLKPDGLFLLVTPGHSWVVDVGLKLLTGESAQRDFGSRRQKLQPALKSHFVMRERRTVPQFGGAVLRLYTALKLALPH